MTETNGGEGCPGQMDTDIPISLKLLATHLGVGAIIGKHGSSITEIQSASGAKIQISGPNEVFPGTTERVMHLSGEMLKVWGLSRSCSVSSA
jgi:RNA-binding protein Nova